MTKVTIDPGICGFITTADAVSEDQLEVKIKVETECPYLRQMFDELDDTFSIFDIILKKPGDGVFWDKARAMGDDFPGDTACPVFTGVVKCIEAECRMAIPKDASITFTQTNDDGDQTRVL